MWRNPAAPDHRRSGSVSSDEHVESLVVAEAACLGHQFRSDGLREELRLTILHRQLRSAALQHRRILGVPMVYGMDGH